MYEKNIALLRNNNAILHSKLLGISLDSAKYQVIDTKTDCPTLKVSMNGKEILLHSKYNPIREARAYIDEQFDNNISEYVVIGLGFAYHIQQLIQKGTDIKIFVLENDINVLRAAMESIDMSDIITNPQISIEFQDTVGGYISRLDELLSGPNRKLLINLPMVQIMGGEFTEVKYILEEYRINKRAIKSMDMLQENFIENIKHFDKGIDKLFNYYEGIPIFIVSAGPSLDKNINQLKQIKNKGIILAVGKAVWALSIAGVQPDLIIVTDPTSAIYRDQIKGIDIKVPIIVLSTCDKNVMVNYEGYKLIAFQEGYEPAEVYAGENNFKLVRTGGSVATTALDIAIKLGGGPIIFVGQDLAPTEGRSHARGVPVSENIKSTVNLRPVQDINGGTVFTTKNLYMYLRWIENRIEEEPQVKFVDATEGGAKIKGTEIMKLQDAINKYTEDTVSVHPII